MNQRNRSAKGLGLLALCVLIGVGCSTTPKPEVSSAGTPAVPVARGNFVPANFVARLSTAEGDYQTLFSAASHAVWVDKTISDIKHAFEAQNNPDISQDLVNAATEISEHFIVIECHIETIFRDSSIAYDVSGLRNTDMYLLSANGTKVYPLQHLLLTPAEEKDVGTLKQYNRTNVLVFAMEDIISGMPTLPVETNSIRLYLENFNTQFYFEWVAQEPVAIESLDPEVQPDITDLIRWRPTQTETFQVLSVRFTELYEQLGALTRIHRN